jgi:hypothetical protein
MQYKSIKIAKVDAEEQPPVADDDEAYTDMDELNTNFTFQTTSYDLSDYVRTNALRFIAHRKQMGKSTYATTLEAGNVDIEPSEAFDRILDAIAASGRKPTYSFPDKYHAQIEVGRDMFIQAYCSDANLELNIFAEKAEAIAFKATCEALFAFDKQAGIRWFYRSSRGGVRHAEFPLEHKNPAKDEYYPFIKGGLDSFFTRYRESASSILVCLGEPGTGKTSFLREYIDRYKLRTIVTYDEVVMDSDEFFIKYLTSDDSDLLVVEDADLLLTSRESEGNKTMSKLLNVSDGLIKLLNKKVIFTTNIHETNRIDSALLRPGRCFDLVRFRSLSWEETVAACEAAGIAAPEDRRDYSLAEMFNQEQETAHRQKNRVGFL